MPTAAAIRASIEGAASPVTVVDITRSTSWGARPASASACGDGSGAEVDRDPEELVVGLAEVASEA